MSLQLSIQTLETKAKHLLNVQCNDLCFLENCNNCKSGCLYQAGVLRHNAELLVQQSHLPPIPKELYLQTIRELEHPK